MVTRLYEKHNFLNHDTPIYFYVYQRNRRFNMLYDSKNDLERETSSSNSQDRQERQTVHKYLQTVLLAF
jgi:uncharacterized protein YdcH (DUF465 family)